MKCFAQAFMPGFQSYVCMLFVENAHRNPTMIAFCQLLSQRSTIHTLLHSSAKLSTVAVIQLPKIRARQRWHLAIMLLRNSSIIPLRKRQLAIAEAKKQSLAVKNRKESDTYTEFSFID